MGGLAREQARTDNPRVTEAIRMVQPTGETMMQTLLRVGFGRKLANGEWDHVKFSRAFVADDGRYLGYEVDTDRLPQSVSLDRLAADKIAHELSIALKYHVRRWNTHGITWVVELDTSHRRPLPHSVTLDLGSWASTPYTIPIGLGHHGPVCRSLLETSHILVGGESRSGKSTWLNSALVALLARHGADRLKLALFDPKGVEFIQYRGIPHLWADIAVETGEAVALIAALAAEMDVRREVFSAAMARNLSAYNERVAPLGLEPLPLIVAIVDEVTDLSLLAGNAFMTPLTRLASKAASYGIILILATQNPKAKVLDTLIRGNLSVRIAFRVASGDHSRVILGRAGAERLPRTVRGRMMARLDADLIELQGYHVPDRWIDCLAAKLRGYRLDPTFVTDAMARASTDQSGARQMALTDLQRQLVQYAVQELGGAFPVGKLYQRFKDQLSHRQMRKLAARWEREALLLPAASENEPRRVTEELSRMAGCSSVPGAE